MEFSQGCLCLQVVSLDRSKSGWKKSGQMEVNAMDESEDAIAPCGGQNCEKWKTGDKWEYYKLYLTCRLKMVYMFFILSILVICNIQKPALGNDMFCMCFKQYGVRSNHCLKHVQNISFPRVGFWILQITSILYIKDMYAIFKIQFVILPFITHFPFFTILTTAW